MEISYSLEMDKAPPLVQLVSQPDSFHWARPCLRLTELSFSAIVFVVLLQSLMTSKDCPEIAVMMLISSFAGGREI